MRGPRRAGAQNPRWQWDSAWEGKFHATARRALHLAALVGFADRIPDIHSLERSMLSAFLSHQVRLAHAGPAWHGASVADNLDGITAELAASRPVPETHSVWEIVLHMTAWTREVARRLDGAAPRMPVEGDWPAVGSVSEESWARARDALRDAHIGLAAAAERVPDSRWAERIGEELDPPLGTGVTYAAMVAGLVQHDAYHSGQVGLLRRALRI